MTTTVEFGNRERTSHDAGTRIENAQITLARLIFDAQELESAQVFEAGDVASIVDSLTKLKSKAARMIEASKLRAEMTAALPMVRTSSQQLTLVKGIDAHVAQLLNEQGIHTFADIAAFTAEDVAELGRLLGDARRIARQGWIEQAELLSRDVETTFARRTRAGDFAAVVSIPADKPAPAKTAEVIEIAAARQKKWWSMSRSSRVGAFRASAVAASVAASLLVSFDGTGLLQQLLSELWFKDGCGSSLTALFSHCTVALLQ